MCGSAGFDQGVQLFGVALLERPQLTTSLKCERPHRVRISAARAMPGAFGKWAVQEGESASAGDFRALGPEMVPRSLHAVATAPSFSLA
jgi:hypothetical protein